MTLPASPFMTDSGTPSVPDETAAFIAPKAGAAVEFPTDDICQIFAGAEKLNDPQARFVLDVQAFMDAIDEVPLFLRRATG